MPERIFYIECKFKLWYPTIAWKCVVPENIHTPLPTTEDHWKFRGVGGGGGFMGNYFSRG